MGKKVIVAILLLFGLNFSVAIAASKIPLPSDINIVADPSLPLEYHALLGRWGGKFEPPGINIILVLEKINLKDNIADVIYANAEFFGYEGKDRYDIKANWRRGKAIISDSENKNIRLELEPNLSGGEMVFDYMPDKQVLEGKRFRRGKVSYATLTKI